MGATKTADPSFNDDEQGIYRVILFKADVDYEVARHRADPPICGLPCRLGLCVKTEEYPEVHDKPSKSNSVYEHGAASISATSRTAHLQCEKLRESEKYGLRLCTEVSNKTNHNLFVSAKRKSPTYMNRAPRLSGLQVSTVMCRMRCECAKLGVASTVYCRRRGKCCRCIGLCCAPLEAKACRQTQLRILPEQSSRGTNRTVLSSS